MGKLEARLDAILSMPLKRGGSYKSVRISQEETIGSLPNQAPEPTSQIFFGFFLRGYVQVFTYKSSLL